MEEQTDSSSDWSDFKEQLKQVWNDLQDRDLEGAQQSVEELVDRVRTVSGEAREEVQQKIEDLADQFDVSLGS